MAKTTKSTKRTSSANKISLFGKINLNSSRNRFIAVILLVAVMGGGWFTYRSFAATTYHILNASNARISTGSSIVIDNTADTDKANKNVIAIEPGGSVSRDKEVVMDGGGYFRICVKARGVSSTSKFTLGVTTGTARDGYRNQSLNGSGKTYQTICGRPYYVSRGGLHVTSLAVWTTQQSSRVYVAHASIQPSSAPTAPTK